jgi:hypothetical protein
MVIRRIKVISRGLASAQGNGEGLVFFSHPRAASPTSCPAWLRGEIPQAEGGNVSRETFPHDRKCYCSLQSRGIGGVSLIPEQTGERRVGSVRAIIVTCPRMPGIVPHRKRVTDDPGEVFHVKHFPSLFAEKGGVTAAGLGWTGLDRHLP